MINNISAMKNTISGVRIIKIKTDQKLSDEILQIISLSVLNLNMYASIVTDMIANK